MYCLVVTDDFSRFSWVFFLATKDETSGILKTFVTCIENLINLRVKVIRCDNGTELKNMVMNQFCEMKGRKPALSFMSPFGCPVRILNTIDHLGKFDGKADEGLFVGYSTDSKAFRVFNSRTRIVEANLYTQDPPFSSSLKNSLGARFKQLGEEENKDVEDPGTKIVSPTDNAACIKDNVVDENIVYGSTDDPNIPNLKEINRFCDVEDDDSRADLNNLYTNFQSVMSSPQ
nr:putative ribonuclease H-like domain-containing protein [Tanacetum cinerariifolium]